MKAKVCEKEQAVVAALLTGTLPDGLRAHAEVCEMCMEVVLLAQSLQDVAPAAGELRVPDAGRVWRQAQAFARKRAIAKATQPIRIARIAACVAAIAALLWAIPTFLALRPILVRHLWALDHPLSAALTGTTLLGIVVSLIFLSLSSWYVLRQE
jgi:hypothetical protein